MEEAHDDNRVNPKEIKMTVNLYPHGGRIERNIQTAKRFAKFVNFLKDYQKLIKNHKYPKMKKRGSKTLIYKRF